MARKPKPTVPYYQARGDFADAQKAYDEKTMLLANAVRVALDLELVKEPAASQLRSAYQAWDAVTMSQPGDDD